MKGKSSFTKVQISSGVSQLKRFIDIVHAYEMAVAFDVVYVHGGGFNGDYTASTGFGSKIPPRRET